MGAAWNAEIWRIVRLMSVSELSDLAVRGFPLPPDLLEKVDAERRRRDAARIIERPPRCGRRLQEKVA